MAHNIQQLTGSYGTDIYAAGSYRVDVRGHEGPYQNLKAPICAVAYVSASVTLTNVIEQNERPNESKFVKNATALVTGTGQMIFSEDVWGFTCDQPVKVWYSR